MNDNHYVPGIADEAFYRETGVPMTKQEIRILSLARLQLFPGAVFYDIGAGSGSVSIEAKLLIPNICVYAIERDAKAVQVLRQNINKFDVDLTIIDGEAPSAMSNLPKADRIFIGGSGGKLEEILKTCDEKLKPGGRLVLNSVTLFTGPLAYQLLEEMGYQVEGIQVNIAQGIRKGEAVMWQARNPVTVISGQKGDNDHVLG